jgi:hypothetical protein
VTFIYINVSNIIHQHNLQDRISALYLIFPGLRGDDGRILVSNHGDGDVFLSYVVVSWGASEGNNGNIGLPLETDLTRSSVSLIPIKLDEDKPLFTTHKWHSVIANNSGVASTKMINEAFSLNEKKCVAPIVITSNHPDFIRMKEFYKDHSGQLAVAPVKAHIEFISHHTGEALKAVIPNALAIFASVADFSCKPSDWSSE